MKTVNRLTVNQEENYGGYPGQLVQLTSTDTTYSSASEVTTLWRYTNLFIIIIFYTPGSKHPGVKN